MEGKLARHWYGTVGREKRPAVAPLFQRGRPTTDRRRAVGAHTRAFKARRGRNDRPPDIGVRIRLSAQKNYPLRRARERGPSSGAAVKPLLFTLLTRMRRRFICLLFLAGVKLPTFFSTFLRA